MPIIVVVIALAGCGRDDTALNHPPLTAPAGEPAVGPTRADGSFVLIVGGTIRADPPSVEFDPTRLRPTISAPEAASGPWMLAIETAEGSILVPFELITQGSDSRSARFSVPVQPAPSGPIRRLTISNDGHELGSVDGTGTVPTVRVTTPEAGASIAVDEFEIAWASDRDATAAAYLSLDGGASWTSIVTQTTASPIRPEPGVVAPSEDALVLVTVSDGVDAAFDRTGPFTLTGGS